MVITDTHCCTAWTLANDSETETEAGREREANGLTHTHKSIMARLKWSNNYDRALLITEHRTLVNIV